MCKFIRYVDAGETVMLNIRYIVEARYNAKDNRLAITTQDGSEGLQTRYLAGKEAQDSVAIIGECVKV